jgi:hypothetical protein
MVVLQRTSGKNAVHLVGLVCAERSPKEKINKIKNLIFI